MVIELWVTAHKEQNPAYRSSAYFWTKVQKYGWQGAIGAAKCTATQDLRRRTPALDGGPEMRVAKSLKKAKTFFGAVRKACLLANVQRHTELEAR